MTITDNLKELAADLLHSGASIQEVADQLSLPLKDAEYLCFLLCRQQPEDFNINDYLTKEWLEEKLGSHSIIEIANLTGLRYRQVQYYLRKYGLSARKSTKLPLLEEQELRRLYVDDGLSDRTIAEQYHTTAYIIKSLRYKFGIFKTERIVAAQLLTKEFFYRLYVELNIGLSQMAQLFNTSRPTILQYKKRYAAGNDSMSKSIAAHRASRRHQELLSRMLDEIPHRLLIDKLQKQGILEIAAEYNLIDNANNKLIPFSREWFFYEMQSISPTKIAKETRRPYSEICQMMDALGIDRSQRRAEIDPGLLRYLSLELYWSDEEIAAQVHLPVTAITQQRRSEGIHMKDRTPLEKRLPPALFSKLYLEENLTAAQIAKLLRTSLTRIREVKNEYITQGHREFENYHSKSVSPERFEYLNRLFTLGLYKA